MDPITFALTIIIAVALSVALAIRDRNAESDTYVHAHTYGHNDLDTYQHSHWYASAHTHYNLDWNTLDRSIGPDGTPDFATDGYRIYWRSGHAKSASSIRSRVARFASRCASVAR